MAFDAITYSAKKNAVSYSHKRGKTDTFLPIQRPVCAMWNSSIILDRNTICNDTRYVPDTQDGYQDCRKCRHGCRTNKCTKCDLCSPVLQTARTEPVVTSQTSTSPLRPDSVGLARVTKPLKSFRCTP